MADDGISSKRLKVSHLMEKYLPLYPDDFSWKKTFEYFTNDPVEKETVDKLVNVLKINGRFREPVTVGSREILDGVVKDFVLDGTHRIYALYLAGVDDVEVDFLDDNELLEDDSDESPEDYIVTVIKIKDYANDEEYDDQFDVLFSLTRSVQVDNDIWLVSLMTSSTGKELRIVWDYEQTDVFNVSKFNKIILKLLHSLMQGYTQDDVQTFIERII